MSSPQLTVAIPTHNGAERLPGLLEALAQQQNSAGFFWEIVVVDNASSGEVRGAIAQLLNQLQPCFTSQLRLLDEPQKGVAFARQRAIEAAAGDWVAFLDDDTRPAADWLEQAYRFVQQHPEAGAFGGQVWAEYAGEPPPGFERIASFLAIKQGGDRPHRYNPDRLQLPAGAGLVVRRQAWIDRVPTPLRCIQGSGDDFEACLHLHRAGYEIWYCPTLRLVHQIPAWRLERQALLDLSRRVGSCVCDLQLVGLPVWLHPWVRLRVLGGNLKRLLCHGLRHRHQLNRDVVIDCQAAFFWSGLLGAIGIRHRAPRTRQRKL